MNLEKIIENIKFLEIDFKLINNPIENLNEEYQFASTNHLIDRGIYYILDLNDAILKIKNSIIISNFEFESSNHLIVTSNPKLLHYKLTQLSIIKSNKGIHPTAIISKKAVIGKNVEIGPYCVIDNCEIEDDVVLKNHVVIENNVLIKKKCFIDSHSVIGASGLAWIWDNDGTRIVQPQIGGVIIEENCIIATDVTVVRGSLSENTIIGSGTLIAHGTKIGHGCQVGKNVHMANNVSLAGNAKIGNHSFLGSASVISSNIKIPNHTIVGASALVNKNFDKEYLTLAGLPAKIIKENNFETKPNGAPKPYKE
jgi:UDP-3-O-[3-hydroxymyristoyl] glucosamine N-acyltransferase